MADILKKLENNKLTDKRISNLSIVAGMPGASEADAVAISAIPSGSGTT
jgi:hypothetical protein